MSIAELSEDESRTLLAAMQPYFEEDGIQLHWHSAHTWLAQGPVFQNLASASLARVRGQFEVQANQIETLDRRQKELYGELDARVLKLQAAAKAQEKQAAGTPDPALEAKAYEAALGMFNLGDYQSSIAAFRNFLVAYPNGQQAANAQYWIGNAYYALRDYKVAIAEQQKVVATWPENPKAPEALLNIASCQDNLNQSRAARGSPSRASAAVESPSPSHRRTRRCSNRI